MNIIETLESLPQYQSLRTHKQKEFVKNYLQNGRNATKSAELAGYSAKTAYSIGYDILKKPETQTIISEFERISIEECKLTEEDVTKFWADVLKNDKYNTSDRIRVSELVAKYRNMFKDNNLQQPIFAILSKNDVNILNINTCNKIN